MTLSLQEALTMLVQTPPNASAPPLTREEVAEAFYDAVLPTLGIGVFVRHEGAKAYGRGYPELWVQAPIDGGPATVGNGSHVGFVAPSRDAVDAFHRAALKAGAQDEGAPGPRPDYGEPYYGCFVRDPDGHKIEAVFWDETRAYERALEARDA